jgi:hypothetical protein
MPSETRARTVPEKSPLEQQQELIKFIDGVRDRLRTEFQPRVAPQVINREIDLIAAEFDGARIKVYVPVLVNRHARLRLRQLAATVG